MNINQYVGIHVLFISRSILIAHWVRFDIGRPNCITLHAYPMKILAIFCFRTQI